MESKDKAIGTILIIVGLFFIGMGVFVNVMNSNKAKQAQIYQEQQVKQEQVNTIDNEPQVEQNQNNVPGVNVYTEEGTSRYID